MAAMCALVNANAKTVYVKALGSGETRETEDGTSWATAYSTIALGISNAEAADEIHIAQGFYQPTATMSFSKSLGIYGGFEGLSESETIAGRQIDVHQTIISGYKNKGAQFDRKYEKWTPKSDGYGVDVTSTSVTILTDGKFTPPPAYSDDDPYSCYVTANFSDQISVGRGERCFELKSGTVTLDGLYITGFENHGYSSDGGGIAICFNGAAGFVDNCRLYGNQTTHGIVYNTDAGKAVKVRKTIIAYNRDSGSHTTIFSGRGGLTAEDCTIHSNVRSSNSRYGAFLMNGRSESKGHPGLFGCEVTRNIDTGSGANVGWGAGFLISGQYGGVKAIGGCNVHHNYTSDSSGDGYTLLGRSNVENTLFTNNLFVANFCRIKPTNGGTYALFGQKGMDRDMSYRVVNCLFKDNVLAAPSVADGCESYVMSTFGSSCASGKKLRYSFVGCTFDSNDLKECATVAPALKARGVLIYGNPADNTPVSELGVANCTFTGPAEPDVCEIAQTGKHTKPLPVVNSLFLTTDENAVAGLVSAVQPDLVKLYSCTVQNQVVAPTGFAVCEAFGSDKVPLAAVTDGKGWRQPSARPASLVSAADVACNGTDVLTYVFRPFGGDSWQALTPGIAAKASSITTMAADVFGNRPAAGAFVRGAVQQVTTAAQNGYTLTVRRDPFSAGMLTSGPAVQAVPDVQTAIAPVTVASVDPTKFTFVGWYDGDARVSDQLTLTGLTLAADRTLVAKFESPKITVTVDLGAHARFRNDGKSVHVSQVEYGSAFVPPDSSEFSVDDGYTYCGWKETPPAVVEEAFTLHADVLANFRQAYVVPADQVPPGSDGTGSSWANATSDIGVALAYAGRTSGEVLVKGGLYVPKSVLNLPANVSLHGSVDGVATVVSNNLAKCLYRYDFVNGLGRAEVSGITFKGFTTATLDVSAPKSSVLVVTNCTFARTAPVTVDEATVTIDDCFFTNNASASVTVLATQTSASTEFATAVVSRCTFAGNSGVQVQTACQRWTRIIASTFVGNTARAIVNGWNWDRMGASVDVEDCEFAYNDYLGSSMFSMQIGNASATRRSQFRRCYIHDNTGTRSLADDKTALLFEVVTSDEHAGLVVCDSTIVRNTLTTSGSGNYAAIVLGLGGWRSFFINCTVADNEFVADGKTTLRHGGATFHACSNCRGFSLVNTIVSGTKVTGAYATNFVEVAMVNSGWAPYAFNSVFVNDAADYRLFHSAEGTFQSYHSETNAAAAVGTVKWIKDAAQSVPEMLAVRKGTPAAKASCRVWVEYATTPSAYTQIWCYDPDKDGNKWGRLNKPSSVGPYVDWHATNTAYTLSSPVLPDAWGNARRLDSKALGPLPAVKEGFLLIVR